MKERVDKVLIYRWGRENVEKEEHLFTKLSTQLSTCGRH